MQNESVKIFLRRIARAYRRFVSSVSFVNRRFIYRSAMETGTIKKICLDIGAGTEPYSNEIIKSFGVTHYISIDIAPTSSTTIVADACYLPIKDNQVDLIIVYEVIQHIANPDKMLVEITRVLIPNGYVLITFPFLYPECDAHDFHRWTIEGMTDEMLRKGFEVIFAERRGGACFAVACAINWAIQHLIPGQRKTWRASYSWVNIIRTGFILLLSFPIQLISWLALGIDYFLPSTGYYMGGIILARKVPQL